MAKGASISPTTIRIPDPLRDALTVRAAKNGRSVNSEINMILQAAIDEDENPKSIDDIAQQEADKFKAALVETLKTMYGDKK